MANLLRLPVHVLTLSCCLSFLLSSFVGQVPNDATEDSLKQLFSTYGQVSDCKILTDKATGKPKGCAFVVFTDKDGADTAIRTLHERYALPGSARPLIVRYSTKQMQMGQQGTGDRTADAGPYKLYIGNLSKQTTEDEVRQMFSAYGELIDEVVILKDPVTHQSRGVAFVRFSQRDQASAAIAALNEQIRDKDAPHLLQVKFALTPTEKKQRQMGAGGGYPVGANGMPIGGYYPAPFAHAGGYAHPYNPYASMLSGAAVGSYYTPAPGGMHVAGGQHAGGQPHSSRPPVAKGPDGANLFVYGIPESHTDSDLHAMFLHFGTIVNAKVYRDLSTGKSKGFGFVSFETLPAAQQAIAAMDGYMVAGKKLTVKPKQGEGGSNNANGNGHQQHQQQHRGQQHHQQLHQGNGLQDNHQQQAQHLGQQHQQYQNNLQQQYQLMQQFQQLSFQQRQPQQNGSPYAPSSSGSSSSPTNAAFNGQQLQ